MELSHDSAPRLLLPAVSEYDSGGWKGAIRVFSRRRAYLIFSSFSILPSRKRMTRCACCAMSGSWVTRMMVLPP